MKTAINTSPERQPYVQKLMRYGAMLIGAGERFAKGAAPAATRAELRKLIGALEQAEQHLPIPYELTTKAKQLRPRSSGKAHAG